MDITNIFKPDYTPKQMFIGGIFGGNYFDDSLGLANINNIGLEKEALAMLKSLSNDKYKAGDKDKERNKYKILCGASYEYWTDKNWIKDQDPYGWVNWYLNYYYGRRSDDDIRQIKRWKNFKVRHLGMFKKYPNSKKIQQGLFQWGIKT